jgi:hypothetical protein
LRLVLNDALSVLFNVSASMSPALVFRFDTTKEQRTPFLIQRLRRSLAALSSCFTCIWWKGAHSFARPLPVGTKIAVARGVQVRLFPLYLDRKFLKER